MSDDEVFVTIASVIVGPVWWAVWLFRMSRVRTVRGAQGGVRLVVAALTACVLIVFTVVNVGGSSDVRR
jgi:hypothetical protein